MIYVLMLLGVLSSALTMFLLKWYTQWYHILIFIGFAVVGFVLWLALYALALFIGSLIINKKKEVTKPSAFAHFIVTQTMKMLVTLSNADVKIVGAEKVPTDQNFLMVANHRSNYDPISCISTLSKYHILFISKPENFNIPVAGSFMHKAGFMAIDRDSVKNALITINKAADYIKNGRNIFIFPEGTRNRTEEELLEFKGGAFKIATKAQCPIVVAAMIDTQNVHKNFPWKHTHMELRIVDVIPAEKVATTKTVDIAEEAKQKIYDALIEAKAEKAAK